MWLLLGRIRSAIARHPRWYWTGVVALLLPTAATLHHLEQQARHRRDAWGRTTAVWVAADDAAPGDALRAERRTVPAAVLPQRALTGDPTGETARRPVTAGEILTEIDTSPSPVGDLVGPGRVAVTVAQHPLPPVTVGDQVTVLLSGSRAEPVQGVVVAVDVDALTVAVPAAAATAVAAEALGGTAVVGISG